MDKEQHKLKEHLLKSLREDKKVLKKQFILGSVLAIFIATSPFLFYLYEYVPESKVWDTFLFTYNSGYFENTKTAMWMLTGKVVPLIFLIIWFFTCRQWWYHSLLVPIIMYVYQIAVAIKQDTTLDEFDLIYMVPIMALIVPSIYLIRARVFNKLNDANKTFEELEEEFMIKPTTFWGKVKQYF
ncbi:hypothetical protein M0G43_10595 [Subsaxibacter sp. CAU 1640]|uniref:hypothetical protein n=1 Tax=Subsaxibacter sp. CAU 1640 TaxID=2933271 RepID=UPI0020066F7B|nr:hypothetical protein [Subsaxibacter sp. CAU 1640]MCK7591022.1 hypothetical protein [Subsaxibacter sp. CAU 1640]